MSGGFPDLVQLAAGNSQGTVIASSRGTTVVPANDAYGAYTQLVASTPQDTGLITVHAMVLGTNGFSDAVSIAIGAAGSEIVIIPDLQIQTPSANNYSAYATFPLTIPSGSRISAKANCNAPAGPIDNAYVSVTLYDTGLTPFGFAGVDSIGALNNGSIGTLVTSGLNVKGSYTQLVAATARDYAGLLLQLTTPTLHGNLQASISAYYDVAIGAAGSELIVMPDWFFSSPSGIGVFTSSFLPVLIPAGTRLAMRGAGSNNANWGFVLLGLYR